MIMQVYTKEEIDRLVADLKQAQEREQRRVKYTGKIARQCERQAQRIKKLEKALKKLLSAKGDHMTACDRTIGATHPCTCGANDARQLLTGDGA